MPPTTSPPRTEPMPAIPRARDEALESHWPSQVVTAVYVDDDSTITAKVTVARNGAEYLVVNIQTERGEADLILSRAAQNNLADAMIDALEARRRVRRQG